MYLPFDISSQKNYLKIIFVIAMLIVAAISLYFTDRIVSKLELREKEQIKVYAEAQQYLLKSDPDAEQKKIVELMRSTSSNSSIPIIYKRYTGELEGINIEMPNGLKQEERQNILREKLKEIVRDDNPPIEFDNGINKDEIDRIYYGNSSLLNQLRYFPIAQLIVVLIFGLITYLAFSSSRRSEQNRVWVGLAKETAHQLGTPLSSLTAWVEYFKSDTKYDPEIILELEKDVKRLDVITTRFSNIGSVPVMKEENLFETLESFLTYLQKRISTKVNLIVKNELQDGEMVKINKYLFEWVIENVCKNAVDAMGGIGTLTVDLMYLKEGKQIAIDITDTGKGITKTNLQKIFNPGFSTKKRGWGLGLTLAKRIVENYHKGKLTVKKSEVNKGTTFRILIPN